MTDKKPPPTVDDLLGSMGKNLRRIREDVLHLSREEVAGRAGVSANTIVRYEKGDVGRFEDLYLLCEALGISLLEVMDSHHAEAMIKAYAQRNPYSRPPKADSLAVQMFMVNPENRPSSTGEGLDAAIGRIADYERNQDARFADKLITEIKKALEPLPPETTKQIFLAILQTLPNYELSVATRLVRAFTTNSDLFKLTTMTDHMLEAVKNRPLPPPRPAELAETAHGVPAAEIPSASPQKHTGKKRGRSTQK